MTDLIPAKDISEEQLITFAYALEQKSEHPLAKAVLEYAKEKGITAQEVTDFAALAGNGLTAKQGKDILYGGNAAFIRTKAEISKEFLNRSQQLSEQGKTPLFFARNHQLVGIIAVADVIKEDSPGAVKELQNMGIRVVMLTGDNERTAKAIGAQAGVDEVIAGVLPDGKESVIRALKDKGKVAMVGDGINDALALTRADIGIAIGAGTDIAIDAADVVLMKSRLSDVPAAIRLSRGTLRNIHENLFWAFFYNVIGIPLAAGVWYPIFGWLLNPMFGAAAMSLSSFCVVTNALRLNLLDMHNPAKDKKLHKAKRKPEPAAIIENNQSEQESNRLDNTMQNNYNIESNRIESNRIESNKIESNSNIESNNNIENNNNSKNNQLQLEGNEMTKTLKIEGMMCGHCEARVKKCLEALEQVTQAQVSHEAGTAVVSLSADISSEALAKAVEEQDYKVLAVE